MSQPMPSKGLLSSVVIATSLSGGTSTCLPLDFEMMVVSKVNLSTELKSFSRLKTLRKQ